MAELKTKETKASVETFLDKLPDEGQRQDSYALVKMMQAATKAEPKMWGTSIIGFGSAHLKYASGRELDWFIIGFSPRKQALTLYLAGGFEGKQELLGELGKYKTGRGCLYIKRLEDVKPKVLKQMINGSVKAMKKR